MTQIERDTSVMTLFLFLFAFMFFSFLFFLFPVLLLYRHNGQGNHHPSRQKSRGRGCADPRESEKQAQRPRRRLFQVHLTRPQPLLSHAQPRGGSISLRSPPPTKPGSSLRATLSAKAMSVYPSCPPGHLAACLSGCCQGG